ncbi:MAG: hypothetical protein NT116_03940 [Candidatus Parcubacteria bacterium]|nr:hypothetical protein [Candidatus Parcubacteria bacterium]
MKNNIIVSFDKAKEARRASRELFGHRGTKVEAPKKGGKYNRNQKHRNKEYDSPVFFKYL